jgi:hypothetical protein
VRHEKRGKDRTPRAIRKAIDEVRRRGAPISRRVAKKPRRRVSENTGTPQKKRKKSTRRAIRRGTGAAPRSRQGKRATAERRRRRPSIRHERADGTGRKTPGKRARR